MRKYSHIVLTTWGMFHILLLCFTVFRRTINISLNSFINKTIKERTMWRLRWVCFLRVLLCDCRILLWHCLYLLTVAAQTDWTGIFNHRFQVHLPIYQWVCVCYFGLWLQKCQGSVKKPEIAASVHTHTLK